MTGVSLGGWLSGKACSGNSDRIAACVPNPGVVSVAQNYVGKFGAILYGPMQYVAQHNASLLPAGYAAAFSNYTSSIFTPLLLNCTADSAAPSVFADTISASGSPNLLWHFQSCLITCLLQVFGDEPK